MRILHLTPYYRPAYAFGGVVRAVEGLATAQARQGHQVTVLTTDALDQSTRLADAAEETIDGVRVLRRPNISTFLRGKFNLSTPRSMKKTAESLMQATDVLHVHEFRTVENLLVTPVAQSLRIPIVLSPHGTLSYATGRSHSKRLWDQLLSAALALRIDHVLALTENELEDVQALWARFGRRQIPTRFSVLPNGINPQDFVDLPPADGFRKRYRLEDAPTVIYLGRLQQRKGLDILVKAFQRAAVEHSRLLIVGPDEGMLATIQSLAAGDGRIVCTGFLGGDYRLQALAAVDLFALPAVGEGLPMAALEAMASGVPALLSTGCNLPEVATADAGFVVDATVDAFAEKLQLLLTNGDLRVEMGEAARRLVVEKYNWDGIAAELGVVYKIYTHRKQI